MKQILLIIIGTFILAMTITCVVEIRNGIRQASELEKYLYEPRN